MTSVFILNIWLIKPSLSIQCTGLLKLYMVVSIKQFWFACMCNRAFGYLMEGPQGYSIWKMTNPLHFCIDHCGILIFPLYCIAYKDVAYKTWQHNLGLSMYLFISNHHELIIQHNIMSMVRWSVFSGSLICWIAYQQGQLQQIWASFYGAWWNSKPLLN